MELVFGVLVGVIVLTILVVAHELGHALVAKKHGVVVEEFGVGFPPRAWGKKLAHSILGKNVLFTVNWLPLGGFVKLQGENDSATSKGDYGAATFWHKTQILLAGIIMNWVVASVLFTLLAFVGLPRVLADQFYVPGDTQFIHQPVEVVTVSRDMPAEKAGLQQGDKILRFAGQSLVTAQDLSKLAAAHKGTTVEVIYSRHDIEHTVKLAVRANNDDKKGYIGVTPTQQELIRASWSAPLVGVGTTAQLSWVTLEGLGGVVGNGVHGLLLKLSPNAADQQKANESLSAVGDSVAGPVGIFGVIFPAAQKAGPIYVLMLAAIVSLTLAVMNVLPIPALDGGRWFVTALFKVLKKPLSKDLEEKIHGTGFLVLMGLVVLITIADIGKIHW